ncbi:MAG: hypothetical protein ACE5IJ_03705 [Thermoplasmata archaeon]
MREKAEPMVGKNIEYVGLLNDYFGELAELAYERELSPGEAVRHIFENRRLTAGDAEAELGSMGANLNQMWGSEAVRAMKAELSKSGWLKAYLAPSTELFSSEDPVTASDGLKRAATFVDTVVIEDPLVRAIKTAPKIRGESETGFLYEKCALYGLGMMKLVPALETNAEPPPAVIVPGLAHINQSIVPSLQPTVEEFSGHQAEMAFGATSEEVKSRLVEVRSKGDFLELVARSQQDFASGVWDFYDSEFSIRPPTSGESVPEAAFSAMTRGRAGTPVLVWTHSLAYDAHPIDLHKSGYGDLLEFAGWQNRDYERYSRIPVQKDMMISQVLARESYEWLGNPSMEQLVRLREEDELTVFRDALRTSVKELTSANAEEYDRTRNQVARALDRAAERYTSQLGELLNRKKAVKRKGLGGVIVTGLLAAAAMFFPPIGLLGILTGGYSALDLYKSWREISEQQALLKSRPLPLLFKANT